MSSRMIRGLGTATLLVAVWLTSLPSAVQACGWGLCRHCRDAGAYHNSSPRSNGGGGGGNGNPDLFNSSDDKESSAEKSSEGSGSAADGKSQAELSALITAIAPAVIGEVLRRVGKDGKPLVGTVPVAAANDFENRLTALEGRVKKLEEPQPPPPPLPPALSPEQQQILEIAEMLNARLQANQKANREEFFEKLKNALK